MVSWPWSALGLPGPAELPEIRRAYAEGLKAAHPEEDPEGFQRLHAAYQEASRLARRAAREGAQEPPPAPPQPEAGNRDGFFRESEAREGDFDEPEARSREDWDYDALLEDAEHPEDSGEPEAPEWDYERLFAEGEAEAQAARRRKLEELRRKNWSRWAAQKPEQRGDEASWTAVTAAVQILELLYSTGAPLSRWQRFLRDPVFWNVRANLDFIFALEEFLRRHPDLPAPVRRAVFTAYGFEKGPGQPCFKPLYRLLHVDARERRRLRRAQSPWRKAWRSYPAWRKAIILVCFSILAVFFLVGWAVNLRTAFRDFTRRQDARQWEAQSLEWLEEDFGQPFVHAASGDIFAPASDPDLYFRASPYGERSGDWPGYQTNYPHILVRKALEDFALEWELDLTLMSYSGEIGDAPGGYLFSLPLLGAEEDVRALGQCLEDLASRNWYSVPLLNPRNEDEYSARGPVRFTVFLGCKGLAFYESASAQGFDTEEALAFYAQAGPAFCRYILENTGLAEEHLGEYVLQDRGLLELEGGSFFQVSGAEKDGEAPKVRYLLAVGGGMLFCVPEERMEQVKSVVDLYRGTPRHFQLDKVGLVIVNDQVPA